MSSKKVQNLAMSKSLQNAQQKRQDIVQAAKSLFLGQGYAITSMDMIALGAGVTKQTVYRYYPSKEALFAAVMENIRRATMEPYQFSRRPLKDELLAYAGRLLEFHLQPEVLGLYRLMLTEGGQNEDLLKTFQNTGPAGFLLPLSQYLTARCPGLAAPDFAANMFCSMILSVRNNLLMGQTDTMTKSAQRAHVQKVVELFLQGVRDY